MHAYTITKCTLDPLCSSYNRVLIFALSGYSDTIRCLGLNNAAPCHHNNEGKFRILMIFYKNKGTLKTISLNMNYVNSCNSQLRDLFSSFSNLYRRLLRHHIIILSKMCNLSLIVPSQLLVLQKLASNDMHERKRK